MIIATTIYLGQRQFIIIYYLLFINNQKELDKLVRDVLCLYL